MASVIRSIFGSPPGDSKMRKSPSFDDFSMGAGHEAESELGQKGPESAIDQIKDALKDSAAEHSEARSPSSTKTNTWQEVFNPRRNFNPNWKAKAGRDYYDHVDKKNAGESSVWEEIIRSERKRVFQSFDKDADGFIDAGDLEAKLGSSADVKQLIAAADTNGDGKIDYAEFCEMLRNS